MKIKASPASIRAAQRCVAIANEHRLDDERNDVSYARHALDADETTALALAFEQLTARVVEAPYTRPQTLDVLPLNTEVDADAESFAWEEINKAGEASFIDDATLGDDLKSVEIKGAKQTRAIFTAGVAIHYTMAQMRRAARTGQPLPARKLMVAREAFDRLVDRVMAVGDSSRGISYGLCNYPVGTGDSQVRSTALTSADWVSGAEEAKTMLADLNTAVAAMVSESDGIFAPDTLALPMYARLRLSHTMFTDGRPESVMDRFLRTNGTVRRVVDVNRLKNADGTSSNQSRGVLLATSPANFEAVVPMPFQVLPPQPVNLGFKQFGIGRIAGFVVYQPLAMRYLTALPNA